MILDRKEKVLAIFNGLTTRHHNFFVHPVLCDIQNTVYTTNKLRFGQQVTAQVSALITATDACVNARL